MRSKQPAKVSQWQPNSNDDSSGRGGPGVAVLISLTEMIRTGVGHPLLIRGRSFGLQSMWTYERSDRIFGRAAVRVEAVMIHGDAHP
jgi:hypothetical protein